MLDYGIGIVEQGIGIVVFGIGIVVKDFFEELPNLATVVFLIWRLIFLMIKIDYLID